MWNNKKKLAILSILLILMLAIFLMGGYTYSKYLSQVRGRGVIEIAKWNFAVNGSNSVMENIKLVGTYTPETVVDNKLAPGAKGKFDIVIDATGSETGIKYSVNFENQNDKPKNLVYTYEDKTVSDIKELEEYLTGFIHVNDEERTKTLTIGWHWPFESGTNTKENAKCNSEDTKDGLDLKQYRFDVIVTGEQEV